MLFVVASKRVESIDTVYKSIIHFLSYYGTIYFKIYDSECNTTCLNLIAPLNSLIKMLCVFSRPIPNNYSRIELKHN